MKISELFLSEDQEQSTSFTAAEYFAKRKFKIKDPYPYDLSLTFQPVTSLEGCPSEINGNFTCISTHISSLEFAPKIIHGNFTCFDNKLTSLKDIHKHINQIDGSIILNAAAWNCRIESNILGLLKIKNLKEIAGLGAYDPFTKAANIINKYLPNPTLDKIMDCQNELIEAGFEEYAEL